MLVFLFELFVLNFPLSQFFLLGSIGLIAKGRKGCLFLAICLLDRFLFI